MGLATARWPAVSAPVVRVFPARRGAATSRRATSRALVRAAGPALVVAVLGAVSALAVDRPGLAVLLLLLQCVPVVVRERFPVPALAVTTVGAVLQVLVGLPPSNAFLGQAVVLTSLVRRMAWPWSAVPALLVLAANQVPVWAVGTPQAGRLAVIQATTFALAWTIGDAAARRAVVDRAAEREIAEQHRTAELRTRLGAMAERLRIAQELHAVAGAGLRTILARTARRPVPEPDAAAAIEATGRQVLTELDRLLGLLRREPVAPPVPLAGPAGLEHPAELTNSFEVGAAQPAEAAATGVTER